MKVSIKIHENYRKIVAVCDFELLGKKFEENNLQLNISDLFYKGKEYTKEREVIEILKNAKRDDACFNFVGKNAIELGFKAGIIDKDCILKIQGIPHALALL